MPPATLRVYLDEDVDVLLARLLGSRGFDCASASAEGHLGWSDERHLEWAAAETRILITHNRVHFEHLAAQWYAESREHAGIILTVRRANTYELLRRLLPVLALYDQNRWRDVVLYA